MRIKVFSFVGGMFGLLILATVFVVLTTPSKPHTPAQPDPIATAPTYPPTGAVDAKDERASFAPYQHTAADAPAVTSPMFAFRQSKLKRPEKTVVINNKEYPLRTYAPLLSPNDPSANQWWVTNTKMNQAWDVAPGARETLLAVIDTGFGLQHEDLANRWYTNAGESGTATQEGASQLNCTDRTLALNANCNLIDEDGDGIVDNETGAVTYQNPSRRNCTAQGKALTKDCNRLDDDGNGYIDDMRGWDFINNDNSVQAGELNPAGSGTTHGTLVSGIAAATGNNAKGIAGVDWHTKILPIQALDDDSYGDTLSVGRAILYAAEQGADVISLSLGSTLSDDYVQEAVHVAIARGSVVVAAAGNDGCECMVYPANYPEVVGVGALNSSNVPASFSSWGANLDILAPGANLTSSTWTSGNGTSAYASGINGTSFATPMIGGMLTRMLSQRPNETPIQIVAALTESTNRLTLAPSTPHSTTLGHGSLDALKATNRIMTPLSLGQLYGFGPVSKGNRLAVTEVAASYAVHSCEVGTVGSTMVYELKKAGLPTFFTIGKAEVANAQKAGYTATNFTYACVQQPHDTDGVFRTIDLFSEFRNIFRPLQ
jgi:hypothetical protein